LNEFVSQHHLQKKEFPERPELFNDVYIIYSIPDSHPSTPLRGRLGCTLSGVKRYKLLDNEYIGISAENAPQLHALKKQYPLSRMLIQQPATFKTKQGYWLHNNLRAIDNNILISHLLPKQVASPTHVMLHKVILLEQFKEYPELIHNTENLLNECSINFDYGSSKNKKTFTGTKYNDKLLLEKLALEGLKYRYGTSNTTAKQRVEYELELIDRLGFSAYFLITWDIIRYSMSMGYYHVGRGSGANSIVAYCLKITDVDPIELNLYFERFINPKRSSPPDFDIDYSWKERDDVQDYVFKRYGFRVVALLGAMSTFKSRAAYRELGKVYGLPKAEIDCLATRPEAEANKSHITQQIHHIAQMMEGFPNIRSIHAGGILVSEKPLTYYTALDLPPKGFPTTQWDMYTAENIGFEKLDILSQRGIGHIKECAEIVKENHGIDIDVHQVEQFKQNQQVKKQLKAGESIGCFYIESPAMRGLLNKLRCDNYLSLVAASSIIRPGVAKSGMMKEYISRFHNPETFKYLHPIMKDQLQETYGVMVYQEDVMKVCHHFAGLDLADSDVLRRAMSGKYRSKKEFQRIVDKFFINCKQKGYPSTLTKEVWRQIESFAGYSFSKAHSASYAVESFQSLFLKAHYPIDFMVAVINNFGGFYSSFVYFNEAQRWGAHLHLPCVNNSNLKTSIKGKDIYIGFIHIKNMENNIAKIIEQERTANGIFTSLGHFIKRIPMGIEQLTILIRINALRFTKKTKADLLWEAYLYTGKEVTQQPTLPTLFQISPKQYKLPVLAGCPLEDAYDEVELLGFPVSQNRFDMLQQMPTNTIMAKNLKNNVGKKIRILGNFATLKYAYTSKKEIMNFGTFIDTQGEFFDSVHFPNSLIHSKFRGLGVYLIQGKVTQDFDYPSITVIRMDKIPVKPDPRS